MSSRSNLVLPEARLLQKAGLLFGGGLLIAYLETRFRQTLVMFSSQRSPQPAKAGLVDDNGNRLGRLRSISNCIQNRSAFVNDS